MTKSVLRGLLLVGMVLLLGLGAWQVSAWANRPLAEPLALSKVEPAVNQPALTPDVAGVCGNRGTLVVLFTGADFSGGVWPLGADAVRLVKVDFSNQKVDSVAFSRDLLLETKMLPNMPSQRLGLAYHYAKQAASGGAEDKIIAGTNTVAQTLVDAFGVAPEVYITVQLDSVQAMIDTLGGVPVNLPQGLTSDSGVNFPAGQQTLNGALSAEYLRTYDPGGDLARMKRQNLYLQALQARVISAGAVAKAPELLQQFDQAIVTDLSPKQLADLACLIEKVPPEQVTFHEISGNLLRAGEDGAVLPDTAGIKTFLQGIFGAQ